MRRGSASIVANPVLVGAVTTLVVVVAIFLAYNANNGLPFVPTREVKVLVPNGANLVKGNEVREGGYRVGVITEMIPARGGDGKIGAQMTLKLDRKGGALPVDTRVVVRPRSALGLKYVDIQRGDADEVFEEGDTVPVDQASIPVEQDEVYNIFDERTRAASAENLEGFGDALAGRGGALSEFIVQAPRLFGLLAPVMKNLDDDRTGLQRFFRELGDAARVVAPVSETQARLFTTMADTFEAISRDPQALKDTISKSPPTLDASIRSLRVQRPFLDDTAKFSRDLAFVARDLRPALPVINEALEVGTPVVRRSVELNEELQGAMVALRDLATAPTTNAALRSLTDTVTTLQPQLRFLGPYVTLCNSWNYFWTLVAEHFTAPTTTGTAERAMLNTAGRQQDSIGSMGATRPAAGKNVLEGVPQYLHGNYYGRAIFADGKADCEAGQQGFVHGANPFDPRSKTDPDVRRVVLDPTHNTSRQGTTFKRLKNGMGEGGLNRDELPAGQTFSVEPGGLGAQLEQP